MRQTRVTGNLFQTLGSRSQLGRLLMPDDDRLDAPLVAVMSNELWRDRFGADSAIIGRTFTIDGQPTTIVGVSPVDFRVPVGAQLFRSDLWTPIRSTDQQRAARRNNNLQTLGSLAHGATIQGAEAELRTIFAGLIAENPQLRDDNVRVAALQAENTRGIRKPLLLLFGAVVIVLLIAATNVAAAPACRFAHLSQLNGLSLNPAVLAFALILSTVAAVVCGAAPAWRSTRVDPQEALRSGRGGGADRSHHRALSALVILEISLSLVLLIGAGLVLKGFARLLANDPGFEPVADPDTADLGIANTVSRRHRCPRPRRTGTGSHAPRSRCGGRCRDQCGAVCHVGQQLGYSL